MSGCGNKWARRPIIWIRASECWPRMSHILIAAMEGALPLNPFLKWLGSGKDSFLSVFRFAAGKDGGERRLFASYLNWTKRCDDIRNSQPVAHH